MNTIALYMRLSNEDLHTEESNSIKNQRELLYDFLKNHHEFDDYNIMEFCDDGYSGVHFQRPGIQKLLSLVGNTIQCILVKDFSRFGRNLIEVGNYLDQVFPFLGVRFIAVNEQYDSKKSLGSAVSLEVSFKAMIYELYSRDISEKIRCVQREKMKKGEYLCSIAFYGYQRSQIEKNKLVIDETAAEVVRDIFHMVLKGISLSEIARTLNGNGVPSPLMYRKEKQTDGVRGWHRAGEVTYWTRESVKRIVSDERYTGCLISGKQKVDLFTKRIESIPQSEWIVVENAYEAIVSKELYQQAQKRFRHHGEMVKSRKPKQKYYGLIRCAYCGRALKRRLCKEIYFSCPSKEALWDSPCADISLKEQELEQILFHSIQTQLQVMRKTVEKKQEEQKQKRKSFQERQKECQTVICHYKSIQKTLLEDYIEGRIQRQEYLFRKEKAVEQQKEAAKQYEKLSEEVSLAEQERISSIKEWEQNMDKKELTRELLEEFVQVIKVSGTDTIEIVWNGKESNEYIK